MVVRVCKFWLKMHAFLSTNKSVIVKTKNIVRDSCRCQQWNSFCVFKSARRLGSSLQIPCPVTTRRLLSTPLISGTYSLGNARGIVHLHLGNPILQFPHDFPLISLGHYKTDTITVRHFYVSSKWNDKEPLKPSSKVEVTVQALKKDLKENETAKTAASETKVKKSLKQKIIDELVHYYHGFRLLFIDIKISGKLVWRVLQGKSLTRREHRLLVRTVSDLFRLVPFSVFVIVPFMELLLPLAIKLFPGMLPSTFQTTNEKEDKMKQSLKVKLEMAKFLQKTLDDMAVQGKGHNSKSAKEFAEFFMKVRSSGEQATNEEIMKFSKLFEDEITLDSLNRQQLMALCRVLEIQPIGTTNLLRFLLRMKLRSLAADDKVIEKEGLDTLTPWELQQACRARGMRAYGMSEAGLRAQLAQWLDLSLNKKVPPSLLLLSRAMLLPDSVPPAEQLKATISVLPDTVVTQTKAAIGEREGRIDNKTKLEVIQEEERKIQEELQETREEERKKEEELQEVKDILVDKAPSISDEPVTEQQVLQATAKEDQKKKELTTTDIGALEDALETLAKDRHTLLLEKEGLGSLKEELADYQEDVRDLQQVVKDQPRPEVRESKAARRLFKKVNAMISKMDTVLAELERSGEKLRTDLEQDALGKYSCKSKLSQELVTIEELMKAIKQIKKLPDDSLADPIASVLDKMDMDRDGAIRVEDVLKVVELVGQDNVKLDQHQLDEILELLGKEQQIELEEQIERALERGSTETHHAGVAASQPLPEGEDAASAKDQHTAPPVQSPPDARSAVAAQPAPAVASDAKETKSKVTATTIASSTPASKNKVMDDPQDKSTKGV